MTRSELTNVLERLRSIAGVGYYTAHGSAHDVLKQLIRPVSSDETVALRAAGNLWAGLFHQ